jgi:hypothetical protein
MNAPSPLLLPTRGVDCEVIQDVRIGLPVESPQHAILVINGRPYTTGIEALLTIRGLIDEVVRVAALRSGASMPSLPQ